MHTSYHNFNALFDRYKRYYIYQHGEAKYEKTKAKIRSSEKLNKLLQASIQYRMMPTEGDFGATLQEVLYFMFAGAETSVMGELLAMQYWNDTINAKYSFCGDATLLNNAQASLTRWQIYYPAGF